MNAAEPFGARVTSGPPRRRDVVAPERDVATGRYRGGRGRDEKDRRPERDQPARPGQGPRGRPRRLRPWHVAAGVGVAVVAAGAVALVAGGGDDAPSATPATGVLATVAAPATEAVDLAATAAVASTAVAVAQTAALVTVPPAASVASISSVVPIDVATALAGDYTFAMTISDGNANFPIGTAQEVAVTLVADCAGSGCAVSSPQYPDIPWSFDGDRFAATGTVTEACLSDPGITVDTTIDVVLAVAGRDDGGLPSALTGTQTQATPGAAACPNTLNDPITWSIAATRTG